MIGSPERKRTKQGESDGRYKEGEKHGETRAMQPAWLEQKNGPSKYTQKGMLLDRNQPARSKWLQDGGLGEDNQQELPLLQHLQHQGSSMQVSK